MNLKKMLSKNGFKALLLALIVAIPPLISTTVFTTIIQNNTNNQSWRFDNQNFNSLEELYNYVNDNTNMESFSADTKNFVLNDQVFNTQLELTNYLQNQFPIRDDVYTYHDPENYVINSAGELSKQVLWNEDSKFLDVYEGKDGVAYLTRKEALDTYKTYDKVYQLDDGREFSNFYDAYNYLMQVKLEELEHSSKTAFYQNGGLYQTEQAIKSWIRKNIKKGFEYRGNEFSDYNYEQFLKFFDNMDPQIIDENIKPIADANFGSYWINLDKVSETEPGTFAGPKYVETVTNLKKIEKKDWHEIDSFTPGMIQGLVGLGVISSTITTKYQVNNPEDDFKWNDNTEEKNNKLYGEFGFYNFLIYLNQNLKMISSELIEEVKNTLLKNVNLNANFKEINSSNLETRAIANATADLDSLASDSEQLTNIHKFMIAIKRILTYMKTFANFTEEDIQTTEIVLQKLVYQILTFNLQDKNEDQPNYDAFGLKENLKSLSVYKLIDLILDPNNFYLSGEGIQNTYNMLKKVDGIIKKAGSVLDQGLNAYKNLKDKYDDKAKEKTKEKILKELKEAKVKGDTQLTDAIGKNRDDILKFIGLDLTESKTKTFGVSSLFPPLKMLSFVMGLNETLAFVTFKTYEYKIDDHQSIYYYVQVPKIPILNIEIPVDLPMVNIDEISPAITNKMIPKGDQNEKISEVYEFQGKYYLNKNNAIKALKNAIYLTPELFLPTKKVLVSNLEFDGSYILPKELKISRLENDGGISVTEYYKLLNEEIDKYVNILFKEHYANSKKEVYTDGLGNIVNSVEEAKQSLINRLKDGSELESKVRYVYTTSSNYHFYAETWQQLETLIENNEIVQEKQVISDDLIRTSKFDELEEFTNKYYQIYELTFYGQKKYFATYNQAWNYILNHGSINYQELNYTFKDVTYQYKDQIFKSEIEYQTWINREISRMNSSK